MTGRKADLAELLSRKCFNAPVFFYVNDKINKNLEKDQYKRKGNCAILKYILKDHARNHYKA